MKKLVLLVASALLLLADANAFDVKQLSNNKESVSKELTEIDKSKAELWAASHPLGDQLKVFSLKALSEAFNEIERTDSTCDIGFIEQLKIDALRYRVVSGSGEMSNFVSYLRTRDLIDDVLFRILKNAEGISYEFEKNLNTPIPARPFNLITRQNAGVKLEDFFAPFKTWPDDKDTCTIDTYADMASDIKFKNTRDRDEQLLKLNYLAYRNRVIDLQTFNRLEILKKHSALDWPVYFKRYFDIITNAKDKMTKAPEDKPSNNFTVEYVSRRDLITQRTNLYRTYNSTQIIILSQIIERTAKRMDAKRASINWQYTDDPNDTEVYVLSPMEQYRAAIKMLRKEMGEVMRSDAFKGTGLEYDHLIAAAYETGFIKSSELDLILRFQDFWNPQTPQWKTYANFALSIAGTATFYLPPPWNIIGAVALVLTQSKILNKDKMPDDDDNWNVII